MSRRALLVVVAGAVAYLAMAGALFAWLLAREASDDYAGVIPGLVATQLPTAIALATARAGTRLGLARAALVAVPGGIVAMPLALAAATPAMLLAGTQAWLVAVGVLALTPLAVVLVWRPLRRHPHPAGARRALGWIALPGLVLAALAAALLGPGIAGSEDALGRHIGLVLLVAAAAPGAWAAPLWALARALPTAPDARNG